MRGLYPRSIRLALALYKGLISSWLGPRCRFMPSCSEYGAAVLTSHGPWRGGALAMRRVCRCHPFGGGGYDPPPVPEVGRRPSRLKCEA